MEYHVFIYIIIYYIILSDILLRHVGQGLVEGAQVCRQRVPIGRHGYTHATVVQHLVCGCVRERESARERVHLRMHVRVRVRVHVSALCVCMRVRARDHCVRVSALCTRV